MASHQQKNQATQFICDRIEDSGQYLILNRNHREITAREKSDLSEHPKLIDVVLANLFSFAEFKENYQKQKVARAYTSPILYKDGKTAFCRMVEKNRSWRHDKSLKQYPLQQINQMISLRKIEKAAIELSATFPNPHHLVYYQPTTERLEESLKEFSLEPVNLDYSHLSSGDYGYGFAHDRESIDYKISREEAILGPALRFVFPQRNFYFIARIASAPQQPVEEPLILF